MRYFFLANCLNKFVILMLLTQQEIIKFFQHFRWTLISRRSTKRAGTRFFRRGCDSNGNVANFVETEQVMFKLRVWYFKYRVSLDTFPVITLFVLFIKICEHGEHGLASFVQTRGSIPFYWTQEPDPLIYMPTPQIQIGSDHPKGFASHIKEQIQVKFFCQNRANTKRLL